MVWQGINLSHWREQRWLKQSYRNIALLLLSSTIAGCLAILLTLINQTRTQALQQQQQQLRFIAQELQQTQQHIAQLKTEQNKPKPQYVNSLAVTKLIDYLSQLKLSGFIEQLQFYQDNHPKLKLIGKFADEQAFEQLITQLNMQQHQFQIEYFQKNGQHQLEFRLLIQLNDSTNGKP